MSKRQIGFAVLVFLAVITIASAAVAQVTTGAPPFGSFGGGPDVIDLANLNVNYRIPIVHKAGRGIPFDYALSYNSSVWYPDGNPGYQTWKPVVNWGWMAQTATTAGFIQTRAKYGICDVDDYGNKIYGTTTYYLAYYDPAGTRHPFTNNNFGPNTNTCLSNSTGGTALDNSGYTMQVNDGDPTATITARSGAQFLAPVGAMSGPATITDSNGNQITTDGLNFTDTTGRTVLTISGTNPMNYCYTSPTGSRCVAVNYQSYSIQTNFGVPGISEYNGTANLVQSIVYPDGSTYTFSYEPTPGYGGYVTGRIASVTLPTGGSISYRYNGGWNGIFMDGSTAGFYRDLYDGTTTNTWLYYYGGNSSGGTNTYVWDPQGNETILSFTGLYETQRQVWQGSSSAGNGLVTILTCWNGVSSSTCGPGATVTQPIQSRVQYKELPGTASRHDDYFDGNTNLTETDDYDWGYALLRKQIITYATLGAIVNKPASVIVQDGANPPNTLSQTYFYYDQWPLWTPPGTTPQQVAVSGSRGNLTEVQMWGGGNSWFYHNMDYYNTGMIHDNRDINTQPTYFNYADSSSTCGNAFPTSVTPPTGASGVDLTSHTTWNCDGGVATSTQDANGATNSVTAWDSYFWRPTATSDPTGFTFHANYGSPNGWNTPPNWTDVYTTFNNNNSLLDKVTKVDGLGRAQVAQRRQAPYPFGTFDSVQTTYDAVGRPYQVSMPYAGGVFQGAPAGTPFASTVYDALGRPTQVTAPDGQGITKYTYWNNDVLIEITPAPGTENTKQKVYESDALGRLTSVCEVVTDTQHLTGSGPCGQSIAKNGYLTKYTYDTAVVNSVPYTRMTVTQNAQAPAQQQTRTFLYDPLGRMVQETNPETGTVSYFYDSDATCGIGSAGDLIRRVDAAGQYICYAYDTLHRETGRSSYAAGGGTRIRGSVSVYDAATVNGVAMANVKGRLAEAFTCITCGSQPVIITDEGFSYSVRGETTDVYQSTPHSGGYYHVGASYWESGALKNWTMPGVPAITYGASDGSGLDGEGRITKVTAASGPTPVTNVTYNNTDPVTSQQPLGALLSVGLGTTTQGQSDTDSFRYDYQTGRMTQYGFNVNAQGEAGTLTWNPNGSLQRLVIADGLSVFDNQVCDYSHDDLGRAASVNCDSAWGTLWSQSFSFDPFGNIRKSGSLTFQPTYSTTNNEIISAGYSYDGNGNLLADATGGHNYTWDPEGKPATIDGVGLTYDVFGRAVEQQRGSSYTQIVYDPSGGKLALMNGQLLNKAFVPLPGGDTAVYTPSGLAYYRHTDWLGSSRLDSTPARSMFSSTAYAPYGENYDGSGATDLSFTGQNQDTVPGLYDFMFREYSPNQARWISPDPAGRGAVSMTNPQSWNRYAYVGNSPLNATDPLGLFVVQCAVIKGSFVCADSGGGMAGVGIDADSISGGNGQWWGVGNYGGDISAPGYSITAPTAQLAAWEQQSEMDYQKQVDCGFNPGSCPNGFTRTRDLPPGMVVSGGYLISGGAVWGNDGWLGNSFFEAFGPELIPWSEYDNRMAQLPAAMAEARLREAHPNMSPEDFKIFELSQMVTSPSTWDTHYENKLGCQFLNFEVAAFGVGAGGVGAGFLFEVPAAFGAASGGGAGAYFLLQSFTGFCQ
jgi:RHS repeat-associated protein